MIVQALQPFRRIVECAGLCRVVQILAREEVQVSAFVQVLLAEARRLRMPQMWLLATPTEIFPVLAMPYENESLPEELGIDLEVQGELEFRRE